MLTNSNRIWSWWNISTLPWQYAARFCGLTRTLIVLIFSWTQLTLSLAARYTPSFGAELVSQCHVRISDDLTLTARKSVCNCDVRAVSYSCDVEHKVLTIFYPLAGVGSPACCLLSPPSPWVSCWQGVSKTSKRHSLGHTKQKINLAEKEIYLLVGKACMWSEDSQSAIATERGKF